MTHCKKEESLLFVSYNFLLNIYLLSFKSMVDSFLGFWDIKNITRVKGARPIQKPQGCVCGQTDHAITFFFFRSHEFYISQL